MLKDRLKGKLKKVSKMELMKKKNQFNKPESHIQKLRALVLFVEKLVTKLPGAIKEKGRLKEGRIK